MCYYNGIIEDMVIRLQTLPFCRCLISKAEVQGFIERCMIAVGTKEHHARSLAEVLVEGDHRGHYSHGLNRMGRWKTGNWLL